MTQTTGVETQHLQAQSTKLGCGPLLPYVVVLVLGIALATWLTWIGVPCLTSDHAVYHSPAVELVAHGRMAIPCFNTLFPQTDVAFGCYPPLFQLLLSGWYYLLGFSLRSALVFCFIIHLVNAMAIMKLTEHVMGQRDYSSFIRTLILIAVGVIHVTNLTHFDRQEETALLWIWIEMLFVQGPGPGRGMLSGLLIGLAAMTSPWIGVLGAMVLAFRAVFYCWQNAVTRKEWWQAGCSLLAAAIVAAVPVVGWAFYMETFYPGILNDQFFGTMRYLAVHRPYVPSFTNNIAELYNSFLLTRPQVPVFIFTMILLPCCGWRRLAPNTSAIYVAACLGLAILFVVRPEAYTYLGAIQILLLPCFISALSRYLLSSSIKFGMVLLLFFTLFASQLAVQLATLPMRWNPHEYHDEVYRHLRQVIPPGDLVAVTGRHWDCFQGRNPWMEAIFLKDEPVLLQAKWMVIPVGIGLPPCIAAFERVEEIPTRVVSEQTYAFSLWRRREK